MLQSNIRPQMTGHVMVRHSNFSSSTVQSDQIFSHTRDNKVGNVICIHWIHLTAKVNPPMLFSHNFNLSVMSLTSYSNKTANEIAITELIKLTFSCHLLVKSHNIPACKYESNWPSAHSRNVILFLLWHSSFFNPWQWYKCEALYTSYSSFSSSRRWTSFNGWKFCPSQPHLSISLNPGCRLSSF